MVKQCVVWRRRIRVAGLVLVAGLLAGGCGGIRMDPDIPGRAGRADPDPEIVGRCLASMEVDTPSIRAGVLTAIRNGEAYQERVQDQRGNRATVKAWIDPEIANQFVLKTTRTIVCPDCKGTGARNIKTFTNMGINLACPTCEGSGKIDGHVEERRWLLTDTALTDPAGGYAPTATPGNMEPIRPRPGPSLSPEALGYVDDLTSDDARTRLRACEWLDRNVAQRGVFFQDIMPMLRKARWIETSKEQGLTVYRFWAGRDEIPEKAYYRVYQDAKTGRISRTMFEAKRYPGAVNPEDIKDDDADDGEKKGLRRFLPF